MGLVIAYAQPTTEEPYLSMKDIKKGNVTPTKKTVWASLLNLTDVGWSAWETTAAFDKNAQMKYTKVPFFQRETTDTEQFQWDLEIVSADYILSMRSRRYIPVKEEPSAFFITLELRGDDSAIAKFMKSFVQKLGRNPTEFTDLDKLSKKVEASPESIFNTWSELAGVAVPATGVPQDGQAIVENVEKAVEELKTFCVNEQTVSTIENAVKSKVVSFITAGKADQAKANAETIMKKIKTMKTKFDATTKTLDKLHEKIRKLEDNGIDIMPPLNAMIAAEAALKNNDYNTLKQKFDDAKTLVAQLSATVAPAPAAKTTEAPAKAKAKAKAAEAAASDLELEPESKPAQAKKVRPDVEDITSFVICSVCKKKLGGQPVTQCQECGKRYHKTCAQTLTKCKVCSYDLAAAEAPKAEADEEALLELEMDAILKEEIPEVKEKTKSIDEDMEAFLKEFDEL